VIDSSLMMNTNPNRHRFVLIFLAGISLLTGLWAGIARMGWLMPLPNEQFVMIHGPLMVVGFLGTLIGLERAVALQRWWAYAIPIFAGLSAIAALFTVSIQITASLAALASMLLIAVFITLYRQYPSEHFIIMALSALAWLVGNALWFTDAAVFAVVPWWLGFLVLMIAGERLELSRLRQPRALIRRAFHGCVAVIVLAIRLPCSHSHQRIRISWARRLAASLRSGMAERAAIRLTAFHGDFSDCRIFMVGSRRNSLDGLCAIFQRRTPL
jgi:hypothetical protein